tara:strand:+ start:252 stop:884 length:633 start_codon:yes stop_codon:yes gene_type:complete
MHKFTTSVLIALTSTALGFAACSKEEKKEPATPSTTAPAPATTAPEAKPTEKPAASESFAKGMMDSYEVCRALLAGDSTDGIAECANGIGAAAKASHGAAPDAAHAHISALEKAASALAAAPADDIEATRLAFGVVSESIVALLTSAPEAAKAYHVFECPMAKGYKRWAQPSAELQNPYMGAAMLTCGSEVHDHHTGMAKEPAHETGHKH